MGQSACFSVQSSSYPSKYSILIYNTSKNLQHFNPSLLYLQTNFGSSDTIKYTGNYLFIYLHLEMFLGNVE
jgi:hypothetical protein